jgi:type IV secretion system protein VirB3
MTTDDTDLSTDPLFVGATRPATKWGVTYAAILMNAVFTMEVFVLTRNLLTLLLAIPIHGVCGLLCARDVRVFELLAIWLRTKGMSLVRNGRYWQASSVSPLTVHRRALRRAHPPTVRI